MCQNGKRFAERGLDHQAYYVIAGFSTWTNPRHTNEG